MSLTRKKLRAHLATELRTRLQLVDPNGGGALVPTVHENHPDPMPDGEAPIVNVATLKDTVEEWSQSTPSVRRELHAMVEVVVRTRAAAENLSDTLDDAAAKVEEILFGASGLGAQTQDAELCQVEDPRLVGTEMAFAIHGGRLIGYAVMDWRYGYVTEPARDGGNEQDLTLVHSELTIGEPAEDYPAAQDDITIEQE